MIDEKYGVFVSATGDDTGPGTQMAPYKTLAKALSAASSKVLRVYACASAGAYEAPLVVTSGATVFGGFDCTTSKWTYAATTVAQVKPLSVGAALTLEGAQKIEIENMAFVAKDATDVGGSSVAAFANGAMNVVLRRVVLTAGKGKGGADAVGAVANYTAVKAPGGNSSTTAVGAAEQSCSTACVNGMHGTGGKGGNGATTVNASAGTAGTPLMTSSNPPTATGAGGTGAPDTITGCTAGKTGSSAPTSAGGAGASKAGTLSATGWAPTVASGGTIGGPAQGGGGGGGGIDATQGGGGGGGCGGCGGGGGGAGKTGGSSFGLLSYRSTVSLQGCTVTSDAGGAGSKGANGQVGQAGGANGTSLFGCNGGAGGTGGEGGGGGGGAGGHSIGVGYVGTKPTQDADTKLTVAASPAPGGAAGTGGFPAATKGADGETRAVWELP